MSVLPILGESLSSVPEPHVTTAVKEEAAVTGGAEADRIRGL